jgi:outer membrane protein
MIVRLAILLVVEATIVATGNIRNASAETLEAALAYAYENNPQLEAQRAQVRATDEGVPHALAGYRPKASLTTGVGYQRLNTLTREISSTTVPGSPATYFKQTGNNTAQNYGVTITQNIFNGYQTSNSVRQAEALVLAARETLRATEQAVLLSAATAYINLLRDSAILDLQRRNRDVLEEQLRQTRLRMQSGNVTATDVSQADARLNVARTQIFGAEANYAGSRAVYREVIGLDADKLMPASTIDRFAPTQPADAIARAIANHPTVGAARFNVDAATLQAKIAEGALYPTVNLVGTAQKNYEASLTQHEAFSGTIGGQLTVPIYQGGSEYSSIRQAKEVQGQKQIEFSLARDRARTAAIQAWANAEAAKKSLGSSRAQVEAAEAALNGVREEARLGQRTTLDVLNAQQELVNARIAVVSAERDRVVDSYALLAAAGGLTPQAIGLKVKIYDAQTHYKSVRDAWTGIRTPDGR